MKNLLDIKVKDTREIEIIDPVVGSPMGMYVAIRSKHHPLVVAASKKAERAVRDAFTSGATADDIDALTEQSVIDILVSVIAGWRISEGAMFAGKIPLSELEYNEENVRALLQAPILRPIRDQIDREAARTADFLDA